MYGKLYDLAIAPFEKLWIHRLRAELLSHAHGKVLEIGTGTGLNLPLYPPDVESVTATDPDPDMFVRAGLRSTRHITLLPADAQQMPFGDDEFDTVVATLVFCSIPEPDRALREVRRVLKPQGSLLLLEHVRRDSPIAGRVQDGLTPIWKHIAGGCHLNRNHDAALSGLGFERVEFRKIWNGFAEFMVLKNTKAAMAKTA